MGRVAGCAGLQWMQLHGRVLGKAKLKSPPLDPGRALAQSTAGSSQGCLCPGACRPRLHQPLGGAQGLGGP